MIGHLRCPQSLCTCTEALLRRSDSPDQTLDIMKPIGVLGVKGRSIAREVTSCVSKRLQLRAWMIVILYVLVSHPSLGACAVSFAALSSRHERVAASVAPSLPDNFKMDVICKSWFDKYNLNCTLAYTRENRGLRSFLLLNCLSKDVNTTKLYDFNRNLLLVNNGFTGKSAVQEIPESEKHDPYFPVPFRKERNYTVFDKPDGLIRFGELNKWPAKDNPKEENSWKAYVKVAAQGEVFDCTNLIHFSNKSAVSPYCNGEPQTREPCPLVPLVWSVDCGAGKRINYSVSHYEEEYDDSIYEPYLALLNRGNEVVELATRSGGLTAPILTSLAISLFVILGIVAAILKCVQLRQASGKGRFLTSPSVDDPETAWSLTANAFSDALRLPPTDNGTVTDKFELRSNLESALSHQRQVQREDGRSDSDTEDPASTEPEQTLEDPENCEGMLLLPDSVYDVGVSQYPTGASSTEESTVSPSAQCINELPGALAYQRRTDSRYTLFNHAAGQTGALSNSYLCDTDATENIPAGKERAFLPGGSDNTNKPHLKDPPGTCCCQEIAGPKPNCPARSVSGGPRTLSL